MGGGQSCCIIRVHPLTPNDYHIDTIERLLKEYKTFIKTIVSHKKTGKVFHLTHEVCNINSKYKAECNGIITSLTELYGEEMTLRYSKQFNKQYNILLNTLRALQIERKLKCDAIILRNKNLCIMLGIVK